MAIVYTKAELLSKVDEWLFPEKVKLLYSQDFVKYTGITSDTKEKYTEVIAGRLLSNLDAFNRIEQIRRESSYKTTGHEWKAIDPTSPRSEEQIARSMMGHTYPHIGKIIDYQTPLKNSMSDTAGKIDLLSWNEEKNNAYIIELKVPRADDKARQETLLHCILQIETYSRILDFQKLKDDFELPAKTDLRKAVLVYRLSNPHIQVHDTNIKKLMKALGVDMFLMGEDNKVIDEHYYFEELKE
ncbi:MAG TPA: hypothetical protein GX505_00370 [Clostridiales bacterium]|nr:hypothetical protein [Clostridiales bacterium]